MRGRSNSPNYDRRRSPPRRDRRDMPFRRRRSFSRDRFDGNRGRRASPGFKRFRRDDDHFDRYDRGSPYRRGGYDRDRDMHDRYHDRRDVPDSYRDFILKLPSDVTPEEAHRRYQEYLTEWHGSLVKSEFERFKEDEWMKMKYDPRTILQIIEKHKTHGQNAAKEFAEAIKPGNELDVESAEFDQGVAKSAAAEPVKEEAEGEKVVVAPRVCWTKERIESDLKLSTELIQKLDAEKEVTENPIVAASPEKKEPEEKPEGEEATAEEKPAETESSDEPDSATIKKLDLVLSYLWRVHMVDYYSGHELNDKEYETAKCRMLRPPKDQVSDEQTDKRMLEELKVRVDTYWADRIRNGDPLKIRTQAEKVEKGVDDFVESQVIQIDNKKWGNKLSSKMFVGKEFVVKHIRLKHCAVVDAERDKILYEIYYDNFRKEKEKQERKMAEERDRALRFGPQGMDGSYPDAFGHGGAPGVIAGQGIMGAPIVPAPLMGAPLGQMLMPAPGAGPMGPFVLQPVPTGGGMGPMEMGPMTGGRGRGLEKQGSMNGGRFGVSRSWSRQRDYYDLDAPQNNRAVLDYGDL